jgi:hypothetical protein
MSEYNRTVDNIRYASGLILDANESGHNEELKEISLALQLIIRNNTETIRAIINEGFKSVPADAPNEHIREYINKGIDTIYPDLSPTERLRRRAMTAAVVGHAATYQSHLSLEEVMAPDTLHDAVDALYDDTQS